MLRRAMREQMSTGAQPGALAGAAVSFFAVLAALWDGEAKLRRATATAVTDETS
jgi:hypothetical protein